MIRDRTGGALLEVAVALLLLAVGALALAAGIGASERARRGALALGLALSAAEGWLEAWRAAPWSGASGSGAEDLAWGPWQGRREWRVVILQPCLLEAVVAVEVAGQRAELATHRFREGVVGCGP